MEHVLRVEIAELPEEVYELSPLDRGSLVHDTLDTFLREVLARPGGASGARRAVDRRRSRPAPRDRRRARATATRRTALTGRRAFWHRDRRRILADLDRFLTATPTLRAELGLTPGRHRAALRLLRARAPADRGARCPTAASLRFRGAADRVDRTAGGALLVIDYKTGRPSGRRRRRPHRVRARKLQLPVYAHAARASFGTGDTPVVAAYWFVSTRGRVPVGRGRARRPRSTSAFDDVLRTIVDGIEPACSRAASTRPSSWTAPVPQLRRPRRARHPRPLPRVGAQARRARAARLRRAAGARRHRRRGDA